MRSMFTLTLLAVGLSSAPAHAQNLGVFDGAAIVDEFSGPPDPAICNYPSGNSISFTPVPGCGPGLTPIPPGAPGAPGGIAYDSVRDAFLICDGFVVEMYAAGGAFLDAWTMPLPVFGMGIDSAAGLIWATDGAALVYAVAIPVVPACGALQPLAVPPFPMPAPAAPLSGIDWDPLSGSLWVTDLAGLIQNVFPGGAPGPVAPIPFPAIPGPCWGAPPPSYLRLACDKGTPFGPGHLYLTDGFLVAPILVGGAPSPPTFAFPGPGGAPCFPTSIPTIGITYVAHGITYGAGTDPDGLVPPTIGSIGASTTPNPAFTVTLSGAVPNSGPAILFWTATNGGVNGYACPAIPLLGVRSLLNLQQLLFTQGGAFVGPGGGASLAVPISPGLPLVGAEFFFQWAVFKPLGPSPWQASDGLSVRLALH